MFFGREDVFDWIQNSLTGRYADHILVIHGQRRVGKTSVLKQLANVLPRKYIPVFFDLQGRTHTTLDRFLWWLAREITREVKQQTEIIIVPPEKEAFTADSDYFENHFLPDLKTAIGERSILLTFDEFDNLEEAEVKEELAVPLIDYLRRLMEDKALSFIFSIGSSGRKLENMQAAYTDFFKTALYKKISFLTHFQCSNLITKPVEGILEITPFAIERIYQITSGHPYFTQLCCHELFSLCQRTGQLTITEHDVDAILEDVVERGTVNLKFVWDEASDLEKWILSSLAAHQEFTNQNELQDFLKLQKVRFSEPDLVSALLHLKEKDILTGENRFVIGLLRTWLVKNRTLEQAREELTETNPIASRYIEIGLEFQDSGQFTKAIENFKEALVVSPEHIQAQVNIGLCYMIQKLHSQAVLEFEKSLVMDDEDIAARSGLCSAYLAMGDDLISKGKIKDAQKTFQKVLQINTEHTDARQRLADLCLQRAEKALIDGRDEEALSAFLEASRYSPEDTALAERFEKAKKGKKNKVVADLLVKAEKLIASRVWKEASSIIHTAHEYDPENERVLELSKQIDQQQRVESLNNYLARADRAEQSGVLNLAEAALQEYLEIDPQDTSVIQRLERVRATIRKKSIEDYGQRARSLARQEKFEESLAVWQELVSFAPDEEPAIQNDLEQLKVLQTRAEKYQQALGDFSKKNYERSALLFKEIVIHDENYKDAARLLTESIELRQKSRRFWQHKWFLPVVASSGFIGLAFVVGSLLLNGVKTQKNTFSTATLSVVGLPTVTPTLEPVPTFTPTPMPMRWTRLASEENFTLDTVTSIIIDPQDPEVLYAGMASSGIYKTIDRGSSWLPKQNGLSASHIRAIVIDPNNTRKLYALAIPGGVYKTTDGGENWVATMNRSIRTDSWGGSVLKIDPKNSDI
ncbi:MAG: extracellular ligand-binding receptor [Chloroflexi bacterium]|nr:MAG: extracellular ligand-binding receptor [Chloroflexota bacterium]